MTMDQAAAPAPSRFGFFGDFLNPVLVKEIRQSQRGKVFAISLIVTVMLALLACTMMALEIDGRTAQPGREFFTVVYGFLCSAVLLVVPFQAFHAMGSEWDDHTFEMLVLSNLKPRQIIVGKILAAFVQALVFFAAFMPFLAVAFLLRGVDVIVLGVILGLTAAASLWLTTVSIMFSTLSRQRFLRVLMMVVLAGSLVGMIGAATGMGSELMRRPDQIADRDFWLALPQMLAFAAFTGLLALFISCNLLSHEEENRSTNVRVLVSVGTVLFLVAMTFNVAVPASPLPREPLFGLTIMAVFGLALAGAFLCSEPETLGRRVAPTVPKSGVMALLTLPWFPGRGRGVIFMLMHMALLVIGAFCLAPFARGLRFFSATTLSNKTDLIMNDGGLALLLTVVYGVLYTLVPIGLLSLFLGTGQRARKVVRGLTIFSPLFFILVPAVIGLLIDSRSMRQMQHAGNGPLVIGESFDGILYEAEAFIFVVLPLALIGCVLVLPSVLRAIRETSKVTSSAAVPVSQASSES
jgi:ABC-type transport system involved in multi-copper enzyme maturation permease subunit